MTYGRVEGPLSNDVQQRIPQRHFLPQRQELALEEQTVQECRDLHLHSQRVGACARTVDVTSQVLDQTTNVDVDMSGLVDVLHAVE